MSFFRVTLCYLLLAGFGSVYSQTSSVQYPYPVRELPLSAQGNTIRMAYMERNPKNANGKTVLLLHGKNFNGFYWKRVMDSLASEGFRVVVPDQAGWGKSSFPTIQYSFSWLALNTKTLLDTLHLKKVIVLGHSMGGMLAVRFCLQYPESVEQLILENPIGLEDYRTFVPYQTVDELAGKEEKATYTSYKKYQQTYYPAWKQEYEELVKVQAAILADKDFKQKAFVNALTFDMIYNQPVVYEYPLLKIPVLFLIGAEDRTIIGKDKLSPEAIATHGKVPELAAGLVKTMPNARLILLPGVGHIPHIQSFGIFMKELLGQLK